METNSQQPSTAHRSICYRCLVADPYTEAEARRQAEDSNGVLEPIECPGGEGWHIGFAEDPR